MERRRALVTGAGRLGARIARSLAREGASVAIVDANADAARAAAEDGSGVDVALSGDVASEGDVERVVTEAEAAIGPLDCLVNTAGISANRRLVDMSVTEWDRLLAVNALGTMLPCRAVARRWMADERAGAIVNLSSMAGRTGRAGGTHYAASKAAVNALTEVLAVELGPHGIRVNAVAPGLVRDEVFSGRDQDLGGYVGAMLRATPLGRTGTPDEIAAAVVFLASEQSAWTTGAILDVTGGAHCSRSGFPAAAGRDRIGAVGSPEAR